MASNSKIIKGKDTPKGGRKTRGMQQNTLILSAHNALITASKRENIPL